MAPSAAAAVAVALLALAAAADDVVPVIRRICGLNKSLDAATYDANFVVAMENVSRAIATTGFGFAAAGVAPYKVYAFGQCFGHVNSVDCQICYSAARVELPRCLPAAAGRVFLESCFLRYDRRNFTGEASDTFNAIVCGGGNASDAERLGRVVGRVVGELRVDDGEFSARAEEKEKGIRVYGAADCWRGIGRNGCEECLEKAKKGLLGCLPATDGRAMNAGCYLRYSTTKFYGSGSSGGSHVIRHRLTIALGSIFVCALIIVVAVLIRGRRKIRRSGVSFSRSFPDNDASAATIKTITESHLSFKYEDLHTATGDFHPSNKLGQGGFGSVYKGILGDGREVAVKRLFFNTRQWVDRFFKEVDLISDVQHKNLVKLLGCSIDGPESLLVYEFLRNMSLDHFLFDPLKKKALDWGKRLGIIVGTAEGLAYLHEASEVRIIHRDIKASNILLDEKFRPKIADFGLARSFAEGQSHITTGIAGTLGYMAPEYVINGQLTEKADVYSYGVLVLEIVTGRKNSNPLSAEDHSLTALIWRHYNSETLLEITDPDLNVQCSTEEVLRVFHVGLLCSQATASLRPPMWRVVEMLTGTERDLPVPTQPPFINVKGAEAGSASGASNPSTIPVSVNGMSISVLQGR